ncbi:RNA 2',3'-cyclic phosphodiesterase [Marinifilum sp. D737]|uniref:RNA 2',3'-cyclic phosphodiesterase n=1 Tax=Marinifilum sp. D737 TaxID=2969628 RepID=UPI002273F40D|nr:RNA 2',3'-cyclic phosphodiesterase [Marinifilum sp. D737]MCY1635891.1 RNA 2',3'-cyclic phosphodiesterase [Marinifilum sp. D737]
METKRIFIAIKINNTDQIRAIFRQVQVDLKDEWIKWVDFKGLHITFGFIGATDIRKIELIKNRLRTCAAKFLPFRIQLNSLGAFPSINRARVLWIGVNTDDMMYQLRDEILKHLQNIVEFPDTRFSPHLTIGRIKYGVKNPDKVKSILESHESWRDEEILISEFVLMESKLTQQGPVYEVMDRFELRGTSSH